MTAIIAFLGTASGKAALAALIFAIGLFTKSGTYRKLRGAWGKGFRGAGIGITVLGRTRLKIIWNPLENVFYDFIIFPLEEFAAGARAGKLDRMEEQVNRLEDVGSETRKKALEEKLVIMREAVANPLPANDQMNVMRESEARFKERLKDGL